MVNRCLMAASVFAWWPTRWHSRLLAAFCVPRHWSNRSLDRAAYEAGIPFCIASVMGIHLLRMGFLEAEPGPAGGYVLMHRGVQFIRAADSRRDELVERVQCMLKLEELIQLNEDEMIRNGLERIDEDAYGYRVYTRALREAEDFIYSP